MSQPAIAHLRSSFLQDPSHPTATRVLEGMQQCQVPLHCGEPPSSQLGSRHGKHGADSLGEENTLEGQKSGCGMQVGESRYGGDKGKEGTGLKTNNS